MQIQDHESISFQLQTKSSGFEDSFSSHLFEKHDAFFFVKEKHEKKCQAINLPTKFVMHSTVFGCFSSAFRWPVLPIWSQLSRLLDRPWEEIQ